MTITDGAELDARDGEIVELAGTYVVKSIAPYKMAFTHPDGTTRTTTRVVAIRLTGGLVQLGVRPDDEMVALDGKAVIATGTLLARPKRHDGPGAQPDPQPTLVKITSVRQ